MSKLALIALLPFLALTSCQSVDRKPAPVIQLGMKLDAPAGAAMVHEGDTLWDIAQRFDLSLRDIIEKNKLQPPFMIYKGQRLILPAPRYYNVMTGDSLYGVSRIFGIDSAALARQNHLTSPYRISVGQKLKIPHQMGRRDYSENVLPAKRPGDKYAKPVSKPTQRGTKSKTQTSSASAGRFSWPIQGRVISSFGPKKNGYHNDGVNIAANRGASVKAAQSGEVVYVGTGIASFGNLVLVRHKSGWMSAYGHLDRISVRKGQRVSTQTRLGTIGTSGSVDKPQLHFELRHGSKALNPQKYL